jgi:hypothetical protein
MTLAYSEPRHGANDRTGAARPAAVARPVPITTIDDFLGERGGLRPAFLRIDMQGFDPEVVDGALALIESHPVAMSIGFAPHAIRPRRSPELFLMRLSERFTVIDERGPRDRSIDQDDPDAFVREIDASDDKRTDLICISRKIAGHGELVAQIIETRWRAMRPRRLGSP